MPKVLLLPKQFGAFAVGDVPKYSPGPDQIIIKVHAAALNPVDWKVQKYGVVVQHYPAILGLDLAGEVDEVGRDVKDFKKGDKVMRQGEYTEEGKGAYQQYVLAEAATTAKIPTSTNMSFDEAATLPVALSTGYCGLYSEFPHGAGLVPPLLENEGKYAGSPIVILGGSSSVGQAAIQFARLSGFSPIIATASEHNAGYLKSLGATHVLSRSLAVSALASSVKKIVEGKPVELVYDAIGVASTQKLAVGLLARGGTLVLVLGAQEETRKADIKVAETIAALTLPWNIELLAKFWHDEVEGFLERGLIKPNRHEVLPGGLSGIAGGLTRLENNQVSGSKLVVNPQETT